MTSIGARWGLLGSPAALDAAPGGSGTVPFARSGAAPTHVGEKDGASWLTDVAPSASGGSISEETNVPGSYQPGTRVLLAIRSSKSGACDSVIGNGQSVCVSGEQAGRHVKIKEYSGHAATHPSSK